MPWESMGRVGCWELDFCDEHDIDPGPLRWSGELYRMAGLNPASTELNTKVFFGLVPENERQAIRSAVLRAVREGSEYSIIHHIVQPGGEVRLVRETARVYPLSTSPKALRLIGTAHDITEQFKAEQAVRAQAQMLDQIGQAVIATDLNGAITYVNRAAGVLYERSSAEMLGRSIMEILVPADSRDEAAERWNSTENWTGEFVSQRRDGTLFNVSLQESPLLDSAGQLIGKIGIATDVTERKRAAEQIRTLSSAIEQAADNIVITDAAGVVEYVNAAFEKATGYAAVEVVGGKTSILRSGHHTGEFYECLWKTILSGETFKAEFTNRRKNGELLFEEKSITPLRGRSGQVTHFVAVGRDIGEKRMSEAALRASEERYRLLFESNPQPMWVFDRETLQFLAVNSAAILSYGYSRAEFLSMTIKDIRPPEDVANLLVDVAAARERSRADIWRHKLKSGQIIYAQVSAHPLAFGDRPARLVLSLNVTDRLQAEQKLRESEERFRQLAENINEVFWVRDLVKNRMLYVSPAYEDVWGRSPESIYTSEFQWSDSIHPEDRARVICAAQHCQTSGHTDETYRILRPDGTVRWIRDRAYQVRDEQGQPYRLVGTAEDITLQKREQERARTLSRLAQALNTVTCERDAAQVIVDAAYQLIGWDFAALDLCTVVTGSLSRVLAVERNVSESPAQTACVFRERMSPESAGEIFTNGPRLIFDKEGARGIGCSQCSTEAAQNSWMLVPVRNGRQNLGILAVQSTRSHAYTREDLEMLTSLADHCGGALNRLHTEAMQRASEFKFRRLVDSNVLGVLAWNSDGAITQANDAFLNSLGYSRSDLEAGRVNWQDLTPPELIHLDYQGLEEIKRTGRCTPFEKQYIHRDGRRVPVLVGAASLDGKPDAGICFVLDMSERKMAEEKVRESEERFRLLAKASGSAIWDWNLIQGTIWWNSGLKNLFGREPRELQSASFWVEEVHPEDRPSVAASFKQMLESGQTSWTGEYRVRRVDGSYVWVHNSAYVMRDAKGRPVRAIGSINDVTERRLAEERISEQAALLDNATEAILVKALDDTVIYWNQGAERIYGWTAQEAIGQKLEGLLRIEGGLYASAHQSLLNKGEWAGELSVHARDGRILPLEVRWTLVRNPDGSPKSVLGINIDLTEKKKLEAQFLRAQRMESIGTLAGGIAHDLNNVLAPILMSVELLQDHARDEEARSILSTVASSAQRGADLVRQVLSFAKGVDGGKRVTVNVFHLARDIQKIARDTFPKNIDFRLKGSRDLWTVPGDPTQLHQVLMNLCVNARDAMPLGGRLELELSNTRLDEVYAGLHPQSKSGNFVVVSVSDTGIGIPVSIREKIFDPFFTTKEPGRGTGLGLATVTTLVKDHGGFVNLYSEVGRGTTFKVYLPVTETVSVTEERLAEAKALPRGQSELILVVDDEEAVRSITRKTLESYGYRVILACNGAEAVSQYAQRGPEIALVLTDMAMPVMDGTATVIALRSLNPNVRVIGSSGLTTNHEVARTLGAGLEHFVPKPYTAETLLGTIRHALEPSGGSPGSNGRDN